MSRALMPIVAAALVLTASPSLGRAQSEEPALRARALFEQGVALSREERWSEALDAFRASRALVSRPSTLFNIAIALDRLGRARETITAVDDYLAASDPTTDAADRREAERLRVTALARLSTLVLTLTPPDARVEIDGEPQDGTGATREIPMDPGEHVLAIAAPGHDEHRERIAAAPGSRFERIVTLDVRAASAPHAVIVIGAAVPGARIDLDGEPVSSGDELEVPPGPHRLRARAEGYEPLDREIVVADGERRDLAVELSRVRGENLWESPVLWSIVGGVIVVGAAVGIGVGVATSGTDAPYGGTTGIVFP